MIKEGLVQRGLQIQGVENFEGFKLRLVRNAGSMCAAGETNTTNTTISSKREMINFSPFPPVWRVAVTRANNECFVPIASPEVAILIFGRSQGYPRVVNAWTSRGRVSGEANNANRWSIALFILVDEETHTSVRTSFAGNFFFARWRGRDNKG
jgi:hypothetical protein